MAPVFVDPSKVREFSDQESFYQWLSQHHDSELELWIKIHKVDSGLPSITAKQAIDVVLCWGWIDAVRKGFDEKSFLTNELTQLGKKEFGVEIDVFAESDDNIYDPKGKARHARPFKPAILIE